MSSVAVGVNSSEKTLKNRLLSVFMDWDRTQLVISLVLLALMALAPLFISSPYYLGIFVLTAIYAFVGISWNIVAGFAGQLVIAHISFLAFGAYTTGALYTHYGLSPWIGNAGRRCGCGPSGTLCVSGYPSLWIKG